MPWSGGTFTRIHDWTDDKDAGIPITASRMDADSDDFTSGINSTINKDGSNAPTAAMNWGSFRLTSLGTATARTDATTLAAVQDGKLNFGAFAGTADALTLTLSPSGGAPTDGLEIWGRAGFTNATKTPTFALNATTARTITKFGGFALAVGDIPRSNALIGLRYDNANTRWELLNPVSRLVYAGLTATGNTADTNEDVLQTFDLPANSMAVGQGIRVRAWGNGVNNADAKTVRLYLGSVAVVGPVLTISVALSWYLEFYAMKYAANAQAVDARAVFGATGGVATAVTSVQNTAQTDTSAITLKVTGQSGAATANNITANGMVVEFLT